MSKYGVFSVPYFPRIPTEYRDIRSTENSVFGYFLRSEHWLVKKGEIGKTNYQPVSILPILLKVYGKYLHKQIENYVKNILFDCQ